MPSPERSRQCRVGRPLRFTCQYSIVACSPPIAANRRTQNTLCAKMSVGRSVIEEQCRFPAELTGVKRVLYHDEYIDIIRFWFVGDERAADHKPRQLPGGGREPVDPLETVPLRRCVAETQHQNAQAARRTTPDAPPAATPHCSSAVATASSELPFHATNSLLNVQTNRHI